MPEVPAPRDVSALGRPAPVAYLVPAALLAVALALIGLYWLSGRSGGWVPDRLFDVNDEANVPALFSAAMWFGAALLALACRRRSRREGWPHGIYWPIMAALFVFLGIDEAAMIHERAGGVLARFHDFSGVFFYASVVFALALFALSGLVFLRFLAALRPANLARLVLAAGIFVSGAAGVEMMGAAYDYGGQIPGTFPLGLNWRRANALEEGLEMLGVIVLIHALLRILNAPGSPFRARTSLEAVA